MRLIKSFFIVLAGFFVLITLISLLIPSTVITVKSVSIHSSSEKILAAIKDLEQWKKWNPVFQQEMAGLTIVPAATPAGSKAIWQKNGKETSISIIDTFPQGIRFNVSRKGEKDIETSLAVLPVQEPNTFQVEWKAVNRLKWYPWEKFAGIFVNEMTGPGYEEALNSLKKYVENNQ